MRYYFHFYLSGRRPAALMEVLCPAFSAQALELDRKSGAVKVATMQIMMFNQILLMEAIQAQMVQRIMLMLS